jgi:hypothetical protein
MWRKFGVIALALAGFGWVQGTNAGTEVIRDYGAQEPAYNYAPAPPPPRPIYYAPPAVGVVLYPTFYPGYHRFYGHHRYYARHPYWHRHY